jgi:hypothetical protein
MTHDDILSTSDISVESNVIHQMTRDITRRLFSVYIDCTENLFLL